MSDIKPLIDSLRSMELPKGADSILSNILEQHKNLATDRDGLKTIVDDRQTENADLRQKVQDAKGAQLSAADQERWNAYKALGTVDDVSAKVKGYGDLEAKEKRREREDGIKALGYKPSVFEVIAQGSSYRAEGEGDDRKVYLTVDDKEVELGERATALGLDDLLGVMGAEVKAPEAKVTTPTGAGTRTVKGFEAKSSTERLKEKDKETRYSGM